ncbi:MAG: hypothetical protein J7L23_05145 [Candidatus Diapherotrites archaeon]|nr:hypothetical protein [Candidatus Diapherotrites archaeon]
MDWEEISLAAVVSVFLIAGVFLTIAGTAGVTFAVTTGRSVQELSNSVFYGVAILIGLAFVYFGIKKVSPK